MKKYTKKAILYTSEQRMLYLGCLEKHLRRFNASPALLVSLDDEFEIFDHEGKYAVSSRSILVPAGTKIDIATHGARVLQCFLNKQGSDFLDLQSSMANCNEIATNSFVYSGLSYESSLISDAFSLFENRPDTNEALLCLSDWLPNSTAQKCDPRIQQTANFIRESIHLNLSIDYMAKRVNLSPNHLLDLFKKNTGTSMRKFRLWQRVWFAAEKLGEGFSLTDAAQTAGFADYAHFSRTYRALNGSSISVANRNTEIRNLKVA
jgi:AraC-like DNA-binding protein